MASPLTPANRHGNATRDALRRAFLTLLFERRYDRIAICDIAALAGVGRSTFYEHFKGKDDLLVLASEPMLTHLANAASGRGSRAAIRMMLDHLWDQRAFGRTILDSVAAPRMRRMLATMIAERLARECQPGPAIALAAHAAAVGQLAILRMWIGGEIAATPDEVADRLLAFAAMVPGRSAI
jgi:AcrR family transcriptional regulator